MKTIPRKGQLITVVFFTDFVIPYIFTGRCIATRWAGKNSTFTIYNTHNGFTQTFFFFSPLVTSVMPLNRIK